ncbi:MAG: hypothetical protein H0T90_01480, partial [Gemmatimonadales bacterium]|nr:hypothetical protein [Gemmatimonadales bacterium]
MIAPPPGFTGTITILDLAPDEAIAALAEWVQAQGLPAYRAAQIHRRLWVAPIAAWDAATDLPLALRSALADAFALPRLAADTVQQSSDGTRKYL